MTASNPYTVIFVSLVRASPFLFFGDFVFLFPSSIWVNAMTCRWGMEETALKRVLWVGNSRMELQIPPLVEGFRPSADFHPCLLFYICIFHFSVLCQSILGLSSCFCFSVLTLTAVAFSIAQHANRATEFEAGVRRDIFFCILQPFLHQEGFGNDTEPYSSIMS